MFVFRHPSLAIFCALVAPLAAFAGTKDGGGGGGYVCRDAGGNITDSRLVDLWEATHRRTQWPHKIGSLEIPLQKGEGCGKPNQFLCNEARAEFEKALAKLASVDPMLAEKVKKQLEKIEKHLVFREEEVSFTLPPDLQLTHYPTGCKPEGMMFYNDDTEELEIRSDIFTKLRSYTDFAAAAMHEALYKEVRDHAGHEDSNFVRRLVGCLFSSEGGCLQYSVEIPKDRVLYLCEALGFSFQVFPVLAIKDPAKLYSLPDMEWKIVADQIVGLHLNYKPSFYYLRRNGGIDQNDGIGAGPLMYYGLRPKVEFPGGLRFDPVTGDLKNLEIGGYQHYEAGYNPVFMNQTMLKCYRLQ